MQYTYGTVVAYLPATAGTDTRIDSLVPPLIDSATGQFYTGPVNVQVIVNGKASNVLGFTLIPLPPNTGVVGATTLNYVGILNSQVANEKSLLDSLQNIPTDQAASLNSLFGTLNNALTSFANSVSTAANGGTITLPDGSSFGKNEVDVLDRLLQSANVTSLSTSSGRANRLPQLSATNFQFTDLVAAGAAKTCNAADFLLNFQQPFQYASWTVCIGSLFPPVAPVLGPVCGLMKLSQGVFLAVQLVEMACDVLPVNLTSVTFSPAATQTEPLRRPVNGGPITENPVGNFDSSPALTSSVGTTLIDVIEALAGINGKQVGQYFIANKILAAVFGGVVQEAFDIEVKGLLDQSASGMVHWPPNDNTPLTSSTASLQLNPNPFVLINGFTLTPGQTAGRTELYLDTSAFRALDSQGTPIPPPLSSFAVPGNSLPVQITTVVSVLPNTLSIGEGGQQPFTARISGTPIQSVTWFVDGLEGGSSSVGTISNVGLYTAPAVTGSHTITATSSFDEQGSGSAAVTVTAMPIVTVTVSPAVATVSTGRTQQFSQTVTGTSDTRVSWGVSGTTGGNSTVGTISADGLYVAPASVPTPSTVTVTATSIPYPSVGGSATATVVPAVPPGTITTIAGGNNLCPQRNDQVGDGCPSTSAFLSWPWAATVDGTGNLYIADTYTERIRAVNSEPTAITVVGVTIQPGTIATVAGTGAEGYLGDGGPATSAELNSPAYVAIDAVGNLYLADYSNNVVRVVNTQSSAISVARTTIQPGDIATVAGGGKGCSGQTDSVGDNCPATSAVLNSPVAVILDGAGNVYICEFYGLRVRRVDATTAVITTVAGDGFWLDKSGDGGLAINAELFDPAGIALDGVGNLYISEYYGGRIRKVDPKTGLISTVAGNGTLGPSGDGGPATSAEVSFSWGLAVDGQGNLYIADSGNNAIRVVNMQSSTISVVGTSISPGNIARVAGNGSLGYSGDGGAATSAQLSGPRGVFVDGKGNLYIADTGNNVVRKVAGN